MQSITVLASLDDIGTAVAAALAAVALIGSVISAVQRICPHCGYVARWSGYPVCQKCGRNRLTGGAGPPHH